MSLTNVTAETFQDEVLSHEGVILVDFWAEWCGPCRMVAPILDQLNNEYADKIKIVKVNADENPALAADYKVSSIPTILVLRNGQVEKTIIGAKPKPGLLKELADYI